MTWLQMQDTPSGLQLNFEDYQESIQNFVLTPIASGLDRTVPHTVKVTIQFVDGPTNDVVNVYLDGSLIHTGTTWEDYYRDWAGGLSAPVDSMMFRVSAAAPANSGNGFLIDNFSSFSGPVPTADLASLSLSNATLSPAFDPSTTAYSTTVGNATTSLGLSANANVGAHVVVTGASNLAVGSNTVTIAVTTDDGLTTKTYTVTVIRSAAPTPAPPASPPVLPAPTPVTPASAQAPSPSTSPPMSPQVAGVPDLIGLTADQALALAISSGFKIGTVTEKSSNEPTNTVIAQNPWPLPAYLPAGAAIDIVVSLRETASAPLIVRVAASRRVPIAIRHAFTPLVLTTIGAKATITLTNYRNVAKTYVKWSRTLKSGANYLTLKIPRRLKIKLPGNYRLTFDVQSEGQSTRYSVRMRLSSRVLRAPLPTAGSRRPTRHQPIDLRQGREPALGSLRRQGSRQPVGFHRDARSQRARRRRRPRCEAGRPDDDPASPPHVPRPAHRCARELARRGQVCASRRRFSGGRDSELRGRARCPGHPGARENARQVASECKKCRPSEVNECRL